MAKGTTKAERWIEHDSGSSKCARKVEPGEKKETAKRSKKKDFLRSLLIHPHLFILYYFM